MTATATAEDLTELLERDYRRLLRWYPKPWRDAHGEALVGTLMDEADATDRFLLRRGEWRDFAAAGFTARLDRVIMRVVRDAAASAMLSLGTGASIVWLLLTSWPVHSSGVPDAARGFGPFVDAAPILTALWVTGFIAALAGRWWLGRAALMLSLLAAVLMRPMEMVLVPSHAFTLDPAALAFSIACALLAMAGTPRPGLPLLGATTGWAALTCTVFVLQSMFGQAQFDPVTSTLYSHPDRPALVVLGAAALAALLAIARRWSAAFTIVLAAVPLTAALDAAAVFTTVLLGWGTSTPFPPPLLLNTPLLLGIAVLVLASRGTLNLPNRTRTNRANRPTKTV